VTLLVTLLRPHPGWATAPPDDTRREVPWPLPCARRTGL